jgi:hypothetical protein
MKTFEVWENIDYNGNDSEKVSLGYIKAKNLENAVKNALKRFLTKEQRKNAMVNMSDSDLESFDFENKWFNHIDDKEVTDIVDEFNEDIMYFEGHELVIEEKMENE